VFYENDWRRHDKEMDAQTRRNRGSRTRNGISSLGKTTLRGRVQVQTVGLNAETKMERHRAGGEIFLLTFLFIGLRRYAVNRELTVEWDPTVFTKVQLRAEMELEYLLDGPRRILA